MVHRMRHCPFLPALMLFLSTLPLAAQEGFTWGRPVAVTEMHGASGPMDMHVAPNGTAVIVLPNSIYCTLLSSSDKGCTWRKLAVIQYTNTLATELCGDCILIVGCPEKQTLLWKIGIADGKTKTFTICSEEDLKALGKDCMPEFCRLAVHGDDIHAVMVTEKPVHVIFAKSSDGGKTWAKPVFIAENLGKSGGMAPAFFQTQDTLNVVYSLSEENDYKPRRATSTDGGATWTSADFDTGMGDAFAAHFDAATIGDTVCLSFLAQETKDDDLFHACISSADGGKSWTKPSNAGKTPLGDLSLLYDFKSSGKRLFLTYSDTGIDDSYPSRACVSVSDNGGVTWKPMDINRNIARVTGMPVIAADDKTGEVYAAFLNLPPEDEAEHCDAKSYLLFRRFHGPEPAVSMDSFDRLVSDLGSDDFAVREKATSELRRMGEPAIERLKKTASEAADQEVRTRAKAIVDSLSGEWWKD